MTEPRRRRSGKQPASRVRCPPLIQLGTALRGFLGEVCDVVPPTQVLQVVGCGSGRKKKLSTFSVTITERTLEVGMHEQTYLVEFRTTHYTTRNLFVDTERRMYCLVDTENRPCKVAAWKVSGAHKQRSFRQTGMLVWFCSAFLLGQTSEASLREKRQLC